MGRLRDASTLMLVARSGIANEPPKVLTIQRASSQNYLPGAYVFPGGNFDAADEHVDWLSIIPFEERNTLSSWALSAVDGPVPKALALRITAIRETFEECGILLCKRHGDLRSSQATPLRLNDDRGWKRKIHENPYEFLNLCRSRRCYPDVKALHLFSHWISPAYLIRRYDCKFFVAILPHVVEGEIDTTEVGKMEWRSVSYYVDDTLNFLPPAQLYELWRLKEFQDVDTLKEFVLAIDRETCQPLTSVHVCTTDGFVFILPGDDKYERVSAAKKGYVDHEGDTLNFRSRIMHRIEIQPSLFSPEHRRVIIQNYTPERTSKDYKSISVYSKL